MEKIEILVEKIYTSIIEEDLVLYRNRIDEVGIGHSTSQYAQDLDEVYRKRSDEEKDALFRIIKQKNIDTISSLLRIIDGFGEFDYDGIKSKVFLNGEDTDGDLQDYFLAYVEEIEEMEEESKK